MPTRTESDVFRIGAAADMLQLFADAHETAVTIPYLVDATGVARLSGWPTIDPFDSIGAVRVREPSQRHSVSIAQDVCVLKRSDSWCLRTLRPRSRLERRPERVSILTFFTIG
ncbi:hypothetical protein [Natrarchaeobaculum sulfurireducens]|nr:hypothetical protein [Natrarchaeobaculum sulfurireducens]